MLEGADVMLTVQTTVRSCVIGGNFATHAWREAGEVQAAAS